MNLIFATQLDFLNEIENLENFFKKNRIIIPFISGNIPAYLLSHTDFKDRLTTNVSKDSIIMVSPYRLARPIVCELMDGTYETLDEGPGNIYDLVDWCVKYYSRKYTITSLADRIVFSSFMLSKDDLKIVKDDIKRYENMSTSPFLERPHCDIANKKLLFCDATYMIYEPWHLCMFEKNKEFLREYLEKGNFIAMLQVTGLHYGRPFRIGGTVPGLTHQNQIMIDFFSSLDIDPLQVIMFKEGYVGIRFDDSTCNFGWKINTIDDTKVLINKYIIYLEKLGYNFSSIYSFRFNNNILDNEKIIEEQAKFYGDIDERKNLINYISQFNDFGFQKVLEKKL